MPIRIVTLTTDFGVSSSFVAQMKGVILGINPAANIVDITHGIPAQDIAAGAIALREATPHFPQGSIHVAVVDPGVGTARRIVYAEIGGRHYLAPDNGLLSGLTRDIAPTRILEVTQSKYFRGEVSRTFHGRDILAPVAAHLSLGIDPALLGQSLAALQSLDWPIPKISSNEIIGQVTHIDMFGNLITNIRAGDISPAPWEVRAGGHTIVGISQTYGDHKPGEIVALVGSSGYLEIAVVNGSAAQVLRAQAGDPVTLKNPE